MNNQNWSQDSQAQTRICILESQLEDKHSRIAMLLLENEKLRMEIEELQNAKDRD